MLVNGKQTRMLVPWNDGHCTPLPSLPEQSDPKVVENKLLGTRPGQDWALGAGVRGMG